MESIYIFMLVALVTLAIIDLVVGVSNDAVNFLNSAIGSRAVSFKTIMIVASIGVAFGALSSSGMMEVARKGIFVPGQFMFSEIMVIFLAVMLTDILLLDFFNTMGLPTSTTVSIVFELLGAAVCVAVIKIASNDSESFLALGNYINSDKALEIILGILLSVFIAFTIGAVVQFISRLILSFKFEKLPALFGSVFSGIAVTSIVYFLLIKGFKNASFMSEDIKEFVSGNVLGTIGINFAFWTVVSFILIQFFKLNIYKIIIILGTFALAMAFAGNDLVNFIGVPIAAFNSYEGWTLAGSPDPTTYSMEGLAGAVATKPILLLAAGLIMVLTLWFSSKAKAVVKTSVDLARQEEGSERFEPNYLSRVFVRFFVNANYTIDKVTPNGFKKFADKQFQQIPISRAKKEDAPAFDMVRASVNLMIASVLISIATSMKLPLSTTYVTFMVTMGTSLADRAWGTESAVYRVAGVLNVIGGWFFTAISAFVAASVMAAAIYFLKLPGIIGLLLLAGFFLTRNFLNHRRKSKEIRTESSLQKAESSSIQGVIQESAANISSVVKRGNKIYSTSLDSLARQDLSRLKKNKKGITKLNVEVDELRDNIYYFIKNLDESSDGASQFYITTLGYLQDMTQSLEYISKASFKHVNNNHKNLRFNQIKELKEIEGNLNELFTDIQQTFETREFHNIAAIIDQKQKLLDQVSDKINKQIQRTRTEESSPKNTTLYFGLLQETQDLITATMNLLEQYDNAYDSSVTAATISTETTDNNAPEES
ncbi:inorganic phosphate transporter [Spongiivirga citrea]|uniref:Phosphate transporter n=1 Tax=Spongiivirga citrea TaxID=1481457 RepID=A0A6M0CM76_9FLAO|nr:inorganic phosphate transporter [Spongiivirga citrea]NER19001.1 inorganic phosphate transporter [Spongiivirga citrea]